VSGDAGRQDGPHAGRGRRRVLVALVLVLVAGGVLAAIALRTGRAPVPNGDRGNWHLVFDDDFNGTSLDQAHWSTGWFGSGVTWPVNPTVPECFDPRRVSVRGGSLNVSVAIKPEFCEGKTRRYSAGIVTSDGKFSYTYGFAQIRARVAVSRSGVVYDWPSFWTAGQHWPTDGEDDIAEGLHGQLCWHFHSPLGARGNCDTMPVTAGWHTFGSDWEPGSVTYYYDGRRVGRIIHGVTSAPMYLILGIGADAQYGGPSRAATYRVDYVRVWQHP
jgi:beta-glucanase (GH16 family)